jgi:uncharacterized membrane protein
MERKKQNSKTNIVYGLIVLAPFAVIVLLLVQVVGALDKLVEPLGLQSTWGALLVVVLALAALLLLCYLLGALVRTRIGSWSFDKLEAKLLRQVPGYKFIKNFLTGFAETRAAYPSALVRLSEPGVQMLGFVMEEHDDGMLTVFVPMAPVVNLGNIYLLERERVTLLGANALEATGCVSQWGLGLKEALSRAPAE